MITHICDRCCKPLAQGALRYTLKMQVFAAADPLVFTEEDMKADHRAEMKTTLEACAKKSDAELMAEVYAEMQFDLCPRCQKEFLRSPLPLRPGLG